MRMGVTISRVRQHEEIVYHVVEAYERDCLQAGSCGTEVFVL